MTDQELIEKIKSDIIGQDYQDELCERGIHQECGCSGRPECHKCYQPHPNDFGDALYRFLSTIYED